MNQQASKLAAVVPHKIKRKKEASKHSSGGKLTLRFFCLLHQYVMSTRSLEDAGDGCVCAYIMCMMNKENGRMSGMDEMDARLMYMLLPRANKKGPQAHTPNAEQSDLFLFLLFSFPSLCDAHPPHAVDITRSTRN
jgi:hypothetical protein